MAIPIYIINQISATLQRIFAPRRKSHTGVEIFATEKPRQFGITDRVEVIEGNESLNDSFDSIPCESIESLDGASFTTEDTADEELMVHTPPTPESIISVEGEPIVKEERLNIDEKCLPPECKILHENSASQSQSRSLVQKQQPAMSKQQPAISKQQSTMSKQQSMAARQQLPTHGKYMDYWKKMGLINQEKQSNPMPTQLVQQRKNLYSPVVPHKQSESRNPRRNSHSNGDFRGNDNQNNKSWGYQKNNPFLNKRPDNSLPKVPEHWRVSSVSTQQSQNSYQQLPTSYSIQPMANEQLNSVFDCPVNILDNLDENFMSSFTWNWRSDPCANLPARNVLFPAQEQPSRMQSSTVASLHENATNYARRNSAQFHIPPNVCPLRDSAAEQPSFQSPLFTKNLPSNTSVFPRKNPSDEEFLSYEQFQREFVFPYCLE